MLYLRGFGGLTLENSDGPIVGSATQRGRLAILVVLASGGDRGTSRDRLLALFWPDKDPESAHAALRQALYTLRRDTGEPELTLGTTELKLNPAVIQSDIAEFDAALKVRDVERAVSRYGGPLLDGVLLRDAPEFERWADLERDRRASQYRAALEQLALGAEANGDERKAVEVWTALSTLDPLSGRCALALMRAQARAGDVAAALRHAQLYEKRLRDEFGLAPDGRILAMVKEIRAASALRATEPALPASARSEPVPANPPAPEADPPLPIPRRAPRWRLALLAIGALIASAALLMFRGVRAAAGHADPEFRRTSIAVLPFQNLSADSSHAYFASGLHDELLTQLSKVAGLKVTSGQSVLAYAGTRTSLRRIARELGVTSVVEGSVQVIGNQLRVTIQLIDANNDAHLWGEHYDRTLDDAFAIESDVARQVVAAVGAALTEAEARALAAPHTTNAEAYRLYLQGRLYATRSFALSADDLDIAQGFYERALRLDPGFALARAALSDLHGVKYRIWQDHSPARAVRQREEAEAALRLAPDLPQAHFAMASWHYQVQGDYPRALSELRIALDGLPNDAEVWARIGQVTRRMGRWNESLAAHQKTTQLDPRNAGLFKELGVTYLMMHRYPEAVSAYNQALSLAPDIRFPQVLKGLTYARWQGQLDTLRAALQSTLSNPNPEDWGSDAFDLLYWDRQADSMVRVAKAKKAGVFQGQTFFLPAALYTAWAYQLRGDHSAAVRAFDAAQRFADSALKEHPDDERIHAARGLALAGMGRREEALREAQWLQQSVPYRDDKFQGGIVVENRARILARAGEADAAVDEIEFLLTQPSQLSVPILQLDPGWDPIRTHPRFRALLAKYAAH